MTYETPWYARGEAGEYVLDQVERVIDGNITVEQFIARMEQFGLTTEEIYKELEDAGAIDGDSCVSDVESYYGLR